METEVSMHNLNKRLGSIMFDNVAPINFGDLQIDTPDDLPLHVKARLDRYNEAISRLDIKTAEAAADEVLEWLHQYGTARV